MLAEECVFFRVSDRKNLTVFLFYSEGADVEIYKFPLTFLLRRVSYTQGEGKEVLGISQ